MDMVEHMTEKVALVHQMPFTCDRDGFAATYEKVREMRKDEKELGINLRPHFRSSLGRSSHGSTSSRTSSM